MRPDAKLDARVAAFLARHGGSDPAQTITRLCSDLIDAAGAIVPVNLEMLASFRNARVAVLDQEQAETIMWDGRHFVIRVRRADNDGRQRFSCAHGIIHIYFMESGSVPRAGGIALDSWSRQEEDLCDQGAAELLLPRAAFIAACPSHPDMDDVLRLAEVFEASAEATALRIVTLSATPAAMIVLEPTLKPAELARIARRQSRADAARLSASRSDHSPPASPEEPEPPARVHPQAQVHRRLNTARRRAGRWRCRLRRRDRSRTRPLPRIGPPASDTTRRHPR